MSDYNIALIGFGSVNRALVQLISDNNEAWHKEFGFRLNIVAVSDLYLGSVMSPNGIAPHMLLTTKFDRGGFKDLSGGSAEADNERIIKQAPADIVVEATFTNASDGQPAVNHCIWAIEAGKHVVTTNKGPVAFVANELKALALRHHVGFEYEGAVMSGTPVLRMARQTLAGSGIRGFQGILNGTSNFVLGRMSDGLTLNEAVEEAQKLGYAEADPTADIEGHDVVLKVVILANELLATRLRPQDVTRSGISHLTSADIESAAKDGERWKLIGSASIDSCGRVEAKVSPQRLPLSHPLAGVGGATNAISFNTDLLGTVSVVGPGAGRIETAYALLSDIIAIHQAPTATSNKVAA